MFMQVIRRRSRKGMVVLMYVGQMMIFAGIAMIAFSVVMLLVLAVVFGRNKKKLINKIYGEIQERENG